MWQHLHPVRKNYCVNRARKYVHIILVMNSELCEYKDVRGNKYIYIYCTHFLYCLLCQMVVPPSAITVTTGPPAVTRPWGLFFLYEVDDIRLSIYVWCINIMWVLRPSWLLLSIIVTLHVVMLWVGYLPSNLVTSTAATRQIPHQWARHIIICACRVAFICIYIYYTHIYIYMCILHIYLYIYIYVCKFKIDHQSSSISDKARHSWLHVAPSGQYSN